MNERSKVLTAKNLLIFCLLLGLVVFNSAALTGCSKSDAAAKKKSKKEPAEKEGEEETAEEESDGDEKSEKDQDEKDPALADDETAGKKTEADKKKDFSETTEKKKSEKEKSPAAEALWADLMKGNKRFVEGKHSSVPLAEMRKTLIGGQKPKVVILGCADSRVPPELLFDKNLGDLFVVRVAGNVADPITLGSIEYAVEHLQAKLIVLLGHESCGAVAAAVSDEEMPTSNLEAIVQRIKPAFEDSSVCPLGGKSSFECVKLNVKHSEKDLLKKSSIIKKAGKEGLAIIKAVYKLDTGEVSRLE